MHPVLLTLPLPAWPVPLGGALALLGVIAAVVALLARRGGLRELAVLGVLSSVLALGLAVQLRGQVLHVE